MKRRDLVLLMLAPSGGEEPTFCPSDPKRLNAFAIVWNEYVKQLMEGKLDYKLWRAVKHEWSRLQ